MDTARELRDRLASLYRNEREAMADFLIALAAFDSSKAWREIGYPSLWSFLRQELKLSRSAAFHRKTAAVLIQVYPAVADSLRSGQLCLSTVAELGRVLTPENVETVLPRFFGLSAREAEAVSASLRPAEVIPTRDVVRLLPSTPSRSAPIVVPTDPRPGLVVPVTPAAPLPEPTLSLRGVVPTQELQPPIADVHRPEPRPSTTFLDAERARLSVTISRRVLEKLEAARDALAHVLPDGDLAGVIEHALDLVLAESRKKRGLVSKPRKTSKPPRDGSRHVPAAVAREVWTRSGGRCESVLPDGQRCEGTRALEIDHVRPFARGGEPTVENLRIACRACNLLAARRAFGDAVMDRYARRRARLHASATSLAPGAAGPAGPRPWLRALPEVP